MPATRDVTPQQRELVDKAVEALEEDGGVADRASSPLVDGSWRLIFTTTPGTASPVQRSFVGVDGFAIYQDIDVFSEVNMRSVWFWYSLYACFCSLSVLVSATAGSPPPLDAGCACCVCHRPQ